MRSGNFKGQLNYSQFDGFFGKEFTLGGDYKFTFDDEVWTIDRNNRLNFGLIRSSISGELLISLKKTLVWYAQNMSGSHTFNMYSHFRRLCKWENDRNNQICELITGPIITNYKISLGKNEWWLGSLRGFLEKWFAFGYPGIDQSVNEAFSLWRIKGNRKGQDVQTRSYTKSAFSNIELEAIESACLTGFKQGRIKLDELVLVTLLKATGRRPGQLADLVCSDLIMIPSEDDSSLSYFLRCPRAKQRGRGFRADFRDIALTAEIGDLVSELISENMSRISEVRIENIDIGERLPLFPHWRRISQLFKGETLHDKPEDYLHLVRGSLNQKLTKAIHHLDLFSERTGEKLKVFPLRFRRTTGTRAAQEGYGPLIIAELLDHSDTQNAYVYTENIPEHVDAINRAVAQQLAPLAQAFAGKLVDREADAVRGDDPSSRIRTMSGQPAGTCGEHGFCGALAPIACYTCDSFQPWLDGPHEEVLSSLIQEETRIKDLLGSGQISSVNTRTILAVTQVVQMCQSRKMSLSNGDAID